MAYKVTANEQGNVEFIMPTGDDFVKNEMPKANAEQLIKTGKCKPVDVNGYNLLVNDKFYFKVSEEKNTKKAKSEE